MKSLLTGILSGLVIAILSAMMLAAARERDAYKDSSTTLVIRHAKVHRWFVLLVVLVLPILLLGNVLFRPPKKPEATIAMLQVAVTWLVVGLPVLWEVLRFRLIVDSEGFTWRSAWRKARSIPWNEITDIAYAPFISRFRFQFRDGIKFYVFDFVPGLNALFDKCEAKLPSKAFANAKLGYLEIERPFPPQETV